MANDQIETLLALFSRFAVQSEAIRQIAAQIAQDEGTDTATVEACADIENAMNRLYRAAGQIMRRSRADH